MSKDVKQIIKFRIDEERYAIPIKYVNEIVEIEDIKDYPMSEDNIIGITDVRGDVISLFNTKKAMKNKKEWNQENCLNKYVLLVENIETNKNIGLVVNDVDEVEKISEKNIDYNAMTNDDTVKGIIKKDEVLIPLVNLPSIIKK